MLLLTENPIWSQDYDQDEVPLFHDNILATEEWNLHKIPFENLLEQ